MTHATSAPRDSLLTEGLLRAFALLAYGFFVWNILGHWRADPGRHTLLLLLVAEGFTLALVLVARRAVLRDLSPLAVAATAYALFYFVVLGYGGVTRLIPETVGVALQLIGLAWQVAAKATLGRCFGLLPAARGLVTAGPYCVVRHPIYLGYLVSHLGFLGSNFSWWNLLVLALLYAAQAVRMTREETALETGAQAVAYRAYRSRVRWKLLPFVY